MLSSNAFVRYQRKRLPKQGGAESIFQYQIMIFEFRLFADVLIHRAVGFASAVVLTFKIASE